MIDETIKTIIQALLQYGVLGIITIMLVAWIIFQQRHIMAMQDAIEQAYRMQIESLSSTLERSIIQTERSTVALSELAKIEEGRLAEIRKFYDVILESIREVRSDIINLRGRSK